MSVSEPWSKFFWSDYDADEGLRVCSLAAQGLWMRMLCLMARATPKGELRIAGEPCTVTDLSRAVGESEEMVAALLDELLRRGVYSVTRTGVIFCRRMRKDAEISRKRAENGKKGADATNRKERRNESLPRQNSGKASSKKSAPYSICQKPDNNIGDLRHRLFELLDIDETKITNPNWHVQQTELCRSWLQTRTPDEVIEIIKPIAERTFVNGKRCSTLKYFDTAITQDPAPKRDDLHERAKARGLKLWDDGSVDSMWFVRLEVVENRGEWYQQWLTEIHDCPSYLWAGFEKAKQLLPE